MRWTEVDIVEGAVEIVKAVWAGWKVECIIHNDVAILSRRRWFWQSPESAPQHQAEGVVMTKDGQYVRDLTAARKRAVGAANLGSAPIHRTPPHQFS